MRDGLVMFFAGACCGCLLALLFIVILLRWGLRNLNLLTSLVREIYHVDLLPFICRIEGLVKLALMELRLNTINVETYLELILKEILKLKQQITTAVKKYERYGDGGKGESRIARWFRNLSL